MQALHHPGLDAEAPRPPVFPFVREVSMLIVSLLLLRLSFPSLETRLNIWA